MAQLRRQSLVKFDAPLCETIIETPKPQGREVLVRIDAVAICATDLEITAAGGITTIEDIRALQQMRIHAAVGMAIYTGHLDLSELAAL